MKLPKDMRERTLEDLAIGEMAWTVTWALAVDEFDEVKLNLGFSALPDRGHTSTLRVIRTPEGYWAEITDPTETIDRHRLLVGCPPGPLVELARLVRAPRGPHAE